MTQTSYYKLYNYPSYENLSHQGSNKFTEECHNFLTGNWDNSSYITPSIVPLSQDISERDELCASVNTEFDPSNPRPFKLSFYQRAVIALMNPNTRCRRLLVCSSMGSGKTFIVGELIAAFSNFSLYPNFDTYNTNKKVSFFSTRDKFKADFTPPYKKGLENVRSFLNKHPGVPTRIYFCSINDKIEDQMYRDFTFCPGIYHSYFSPILESIKTKNRTHFGRQWANSLKVEMLPMVRLGNRIKNGDIAQFEGALLILDEVHSVFTPEDVTSKNWWGSLPYVLELTTKVNIYGLVCLTGTPIINSFSNLIDLHRLIVQGDPFLHKDNSVLYRSTDFIKKFVSSNPLTMKKSLLSPAEIMDACDRSGVAYKDYLYKNTFAPDAETIFRNIFNIMRHYVYDYDAEYDKVRMATKSVKVLVSHHVLTTSEEIGKLENVDDILKDEKDPDLDVGKNHFETFIDWSVRSFYNREGYNMYKLQGKTIKEIPERCIRKKLAWTMLLDKGGLSVANYISKKFPRTVLTNQEKFLQVLFQESPAFYQLLRLLAQRKGKALIYAVTRSSFGSEPFSELMKSYVKVNPRNNMLLPIPQTVPDENIQRYIDDHILYDKDIYLTGTDQEKAQHHRIVDIFEKNKEQGVRSPIYFFAAKLSTGFSVSGGVAEMHILTPASAQVEGRGHRVRAHCGTNWTYDVYKYLNVGLFPNLLSTCDLAYEFLLEDSGIGPAMEYAETLIKRSSLTCSVLNQLFSTSNTCSEFPPLPEKLVTTTAAPAA